MKTLVNLIATENVSIVSDNAIPSGAVHNTQSQRGFYRSLIHTKDWIGGKTKDGIIAKIPVSEIWKLLEAHDPSFVMPPIEKPK